MIRPKIITIVAGALAVVGVVGLIAGTALDRAVGEPDLGSRVELDSPVVPESTSPSPVSKATQVAPLPRAAADDGLPSKPAKQPRGDDDDDADDRQSKKAPKAPTDDDRGDAEDDGDDDGGGDDGDD